MNYSMINDFRSIIYAVLDANDARSPIHDIMMIAASIMENKAIDIYSKQEVIIEILKCMKKTVYQCSNYERDRHNSIGQFVDDINCLISVHGLGARGVEEFELG
jgi:hypothetical protein